MKNGGVTFLMRVPFDDRLPTYYERVFGYTSKFDKYPDGFMEKDEIRWFTPDDLRSLKNDTMLLRDDFRAILPQLLDLEKSLVRRCNF